MKVVKKGCRRGSILLEASIALCLLVFAVGVNLELVRRAHSKVLFEHSCFLYVRARALGTGVVQSRKQVFHFLEHALGYQRTRSIFIGLHLEEELVTDGIEARVHYRYPSLLRFPYRGQQKHHFELTEKCKFFF